MPDDFESGSNSGTLVLPSPKKAPAPSTLLDLTEWSLTTPEHKPRTIEDLDGFVLPHRFYVDGADVVFHANVGGGHTPHSKYPRCELREWEDGERAAWSTTEGIHELKVNLACTKRPPVKRQVVIAQVHGPGDLDVVEVLYDGMKEQEKETKDGKKLFGALTVRHGDEEHATISTDYELGAFIDLRIHVSDGHIEIYVGEELKDTVEHRVDGCYFKTGCYVQSNTKHHDKPDAVGEVRIRELWHGRPSQ